MSQQAEPFNDADPRRPVEDRTAAAADPRYDQRRSDDLRPDLETDVDAGARSRGADMTSTVESGHDTDTATGMRSDTDLGYDTGTDTATATGMRSDTDLGYDTGTGAGTDAGMRSDTGLGNGTGSDPDLGPGPQSPVDPTASVEPSQPAAMTAGQGDLLWPQGEVATFEERWREVQLRFVDDPRQAADQARALVDEVLDRLTTAVSSRKRQLDQWSSSGDSGGTEQMLTAVRQYRALLNQVFNIDSQNQAA